MKKIIFLFFILIILFFILVVLSLVSFRIYQIRNINYDKIYSNLEEYLQKDKGKAFALVKGDIMYINYLYYISDGPYKPSHKEYPFKVSPDDYLIYLYGSSSIVSKPPFFKGEFLSATSVLESYLNTSEKKNFKVYNFAIPSFDSFDAKELIKATVNCKPPDLIILYSDVATMDFDDAYFICIKKNFYLLRNLFKKIFDKLLSKIELPQLGKTNELADWFLKGYLEPDLIDLLQRLNLIKIEEAPFTKYNELILSHFEKNIYEIIEFARKKDISLVIVSSLHNLEAKPFGIYNITRRYYKKGMREKDYSRKMEYLIKAADSEIFTGDLRNKSGVYRFLSGIKKEGVYIFDLRKKLLDAHFEFNYKYFYDYGHMRPALHKIVGKYLYEFLENNELLK